MRENPTGSSEEECAGPADACTVEVSKSQRKHERIRTGPSRRTIATRAVMAKEVFFTSRAELTENANTGPEDNAANLYECRLVQIEGEPGCRLTDLTVPTTEAEKAEDPDGAAVLGVVNASEDGSYVYFVANGVLSGAENAEHQKAQPGSCPVEEGKSEAGEHTCSLYLAHYSGTEWEAPQFVATLSAGDLSDWIGYEGEQLNKDYGPGSHTARVTADGTTLAFESERSLTGYDNERAEPGECEGQAELVKETGKCREVYLYDATTGRISCTSCDPSGARPVGPALLGGHSIEGITSASTFYLPRNLSENGKRLFFQTPDALVPADTNEKLDVYEWEAAGEGGCTESSSSYVLSSAGCVFAISDVSGDYESKFMDASPSGNDVFIATADQLVPADTDTRADVYDVRIGGGFPSPRPPEPCKNADSCKTPTPPQPTVFAPTGSATFNGLGNFPAAPVYSPPPPKKTVKCKKPKKLSHGKCVKPKKRAKKSSHGKGRA